MKRLLFFLLLLPVLVRAQGPISYTEAYKDSYFDDNAALQAACNAGNFTLGRNYSISTTITVTYLLHLNGFTINTSQTSGAALHAGSSGAGIDGGSLVGTWSYLAPGNPSGNSGISITANNVTVTHMLITQMSGYGILAGGYNNLSVTYNQITKTGYIGFFYDAENNTSGNNTFSHNTVDRSMIAPSAINQGAVTIRGNTTSLVDSTRHWTIAYDTLRMPLHPSLSAAECLEVKYMTLSTISHLVCSQGSIGISVVRCRAVRLVNNQTTNSGAEGIEFADTKESSSNYSSVNGSVIQGILYDGALTFCHTDTINNDTIKNTAQKAILLYNNTHDVLIKGSVITHTTQGVYCQTTDHITIYHCSIDGGSHSSTVGVFVNGGTGRVSMQRGGITHNTYAVYANNSTPGAVVDSLIGVSVNLTGTSVQFGNSFSNGAHYGSQVYFVSGAMTFSSIGSKVYGVPPFSPGAVSLLPISYVTTGHHTSIVSGLVYISGVGIDTITASNGDTSAVQRVTVTKASLVITADSKTKVHGQVNPALTASYGTMQYSDTPSVVSGVTLATTAVTGSPLGTYPITVSGAMAANYTFVLVDGVLVVTGSSGIGTVLHLHVVY